MRMQRTIYTTQKLKLNSIQSL